MFSSSVLGWSTSGSMCVTTYEGSTGSTTSGKDEVPTPGEHSRDPPEEIRLVLTFEMVNGEGRHNEVELSLRQRILEPSQDDVGAASGKVLAGYPHHSGACIDARDVRVRVLIEDGSGGLTRACP